MQLNWLMVGGTFDDDNGKPSGFMAKLFKHLSKLIVYASNNSDRVGILNGGNYSELKNINFNIFKIILWFPDIPNDKPKSVKEIKIINPQCVLVTSKRNFNEYTRMELIGKMLQIKSNLLLEINSENGKFLGTILDPLGNVFINKEEDIQTLAIHLYKRVNQLTQFTRVSCTHVPDENIEIPDNVDFFKIIKNSAETFHELIHGANTTRFLGNASFRCMHGFPSFREKEYPNIIYVSKRNIDKREIDKDGFVPIDISYLDTVKYYGNAKPSVDTPVQIKLYKYYPNVNYMIHSHVIIADAPFTRNIIPCGAVEEFLGIVELFPKSECSNFCVNLNGHGSIILANDLEYFSKENIKYKARKID